MAQSNRDNRRIIMEVKVQWLSDLPESEVGALFELLNGDSKYPSPLQWVVGGLQRGAQAITIDDPTTDRSGSLEIRVDGPDEWLPTREIASDRH